MPEQILENASVAVAVDARPAWLDQVEAIDRQILAAKTHRNTLVPISKLPPEILGDIFEYQAHGIFPWIYSDSVLSTSAVLWPAIMLVCKYWRDVAINHHALWTSLTEKNIQRWPLFMERSHSRHVDIHSDSDKEGIATPLFAALAQLHRVRSIDLRIKNTEMEQIVPLLNVAAPNLQTLYLEATYENRWYVGEVNPGRWITSLRKDFVSELAQNLRSIWLSGVCFPWGAYASNLRELTLGSQLPARGMGMAPAATTVPVSDVFHSISLSSLESLSIHNMSDVTIVNDLESRAPIALPATLKHLTIENSSTSFTLPIWFSAPQLDFVRIYIDTFRPTITMDQFQDVIRHVETHISRLTSTIERLIVHSPPDHFIIESDRTKLSIPSPTSFRFNRNAPAARILLVTPLEHLIRLELGGGIELPKQVLETISTRLSQLSNLTLSTSPQTIADLFTIMCDHSAEGVSCTSDPVINTEQSIQHQPVLPLLRSLSVVHTDFTWIASDGTQLSLFLEMVLAHRVKHAPRLGPESLEIKWCDVTEEMVESWTINERVNVYWDGETGRFSPSNPSSPRGPVLWDSENEEVYDAGIDLDA
ncbi:unnamed protein product [Peniophora sp. CBMAI 1063]|nr:unnamed protein product [Peniophora sp. CBMAI 1063]